jgi:hypothetical protein
MRRRCDRFGRLLEEPITDRSDGAGMDESGFSIATFDSGEESL